MSWSFEHKGQHAAVQAKILAEPYLPAALKTAIVEIVGTGGTFNGVAVKSCGHVDGSYGMVHELKIEQIKLALNADLPAGMSASSSAEATNNPPPPGNGSV